MATSTQYLPWDNSTLANFKTWGQSIGIALTAFGWTKSVIPTGTVNWSTLAYSPWTATQTGQTGGNQYVPPGNVGLINFANAWTNGLVLTLSSVANSNGTTSVYTGTITGGAANAYAGMRFTVAGFGTGANNGTFVCAASTTTTLTLNNPNGVAQSNAATATLTYAVGDLVTNNNATWFCTAAHTPTATSPAPPFEGISLGTLHWTLYAFEVWKSAGATPIFLRFTYCGGGPGATLSYENVIPRIKVAVGTTVDVSGNLGTGAGNTSAESDINFTVNPTVQWTPGVTLPCYFSGDSTNRFSMLMWPDLFTQLSPNQSGFFCIERSMTNTGSYYSTFSGPAFVQGTSFVYPAGNVNTSGTSTLTNTAGNTLIVFASNAGTNAGTVTITDTHLNSYTPFLSDTSVNGQVQKAWIATNIAGGSNTVTVSWTTGATNGGIIVAEYQGLAASPIDQTGVQKTGAGSWSTNNVTTTQAVEMLVAVNINGTDMITPNAPFTIRESTTQTGTIFGSIMDTVAVQTGTFSAGGGASGNFVANMITLKASPNTPPVTPYWTMIWWGNLNANSGSGFIGSFIQVAPSIWIQTQFDSRIWSVSASFTHAQPPNPIGEWYASGNGNQSIPAFPIWPLVGWVGNPMTAVLNTRNQDAPAMGSFTALLYGTTHTYLNVRNGGAYQSFGVQPSSSGPPNGLAMRFD